MILPNYTIETICEYPSQFIINIHFDKVVARLFGDAKYNRLEIKLYIKDGFKRRNVSLLEYLNHISDFLESHSYLSKYDDRCIDLYDTNIVKFISLSKFKITRSEIEYIKYKFPNIVSFRTDNCTIYDSANMGLLECNFYDCNSQIDSLDCFNYFSGRHLEFCDSHFLHMNKKMLHLNNVVLSLKNVSYDYELLFLMLDAPNLRKLDILRGNGNYLTTKELLFISGLYNLESINIDAIIDSFDSLEKLERLREIQGILISNSSQLDIMKSMRSKHYNMRKECGASDESLKGYLMYQLMLQYNKYLELLNKLYVDRLERVKWQNKIDLNDTSKIKLELIRISKMIYKDRKNIAREFKEVTLQDQLDGLYFDRVVDREEEYLVNSRPFSGDGIDYYVKKKNIIID
ncbi:MAG: hypothetical protein IJZ46_05275 [Bacilli bacterium]|nr:hypothetical protein [Bacilli bacterium]